ncbi:Clathrin heavy chain 2, partial [Tulasnella sp. 419]
VDVSFSDDNSHASQRGIVICSQATDIKTLDDSSLPWEGDLKGFRFLDIKTVCSISAFEYWILTVSAGALVITLPSKVVIFNPARRSAREIEYGFEVKSWPSISHSLSPDGNTLVRWMQPEGPRSTTITSIDTSSKKQIGKLWVQRGFGKSDISNAKWMDNATVFIPVSSEGIIVRWTARDSGRQSQFLVRSRIQHDDYAVIRPLTKVSRFGLLKFDLTKDRKWWTITGVTYDKKPSGLIEVHDVEKKSSREVEGIASCIAEVDVYDKEKGSTRYSQHLTADKVQQLNPHDSGQSFIPVDVEIDLIDKEDVPRGVYVLHPLPIVAITTARSYIYFFELHTGAYLYAQNLKPYKFWISQCDSQSLLMWAYETSAVQLVTINERDLIGYCRQVLCNDLLASTIAVHSGLRGAEDVIFHDMHGDYTQISS